jgi:carnitine-CoA ligase
VLDAGQLLPNIIADRARTHPDRTFIQDVGGTAWSYAELDQLADQWAAAFERVGIQHGDHVLTLSEPRTEWFCAWIGLARIGALDVGVNTSFRGRMLDYVLNASNAKTLVVHADSVEPLTEEALSKAGIELVIVLSADNPPDFGAVRTISAAEFLSDCLAPEHPIRPEVWNLSCIILTSGTTGPSKLVQVPWGSMYVGGKWYLPFPAITDQDVFYQPLPTYHAAGRFAYQLMALTNGTVVQRNRFSLSAFWDDIRRYGCTVSNISPFAQMLYDAPEADDDADSTLRLVVANPMPRDREGFKKRFGVLLTHSYGTSEIGIPVCTDADAAVPGSSGKIVPGWPYFEARIVDEHDNEVPRGVIGQFVIRSREPWGLNAGYFGNAEATAAAWRNGWFHQGDALWMDDDGNLYFHDRLNDAIRVRGENISSFEVEAEANSHPGVLRSAAVAVPFTDGEDELKLFVIPNEGHQLDPEELCAFLASRVAKFMVPRYVELIDEFPVTEATQRIKKGELRARANNEKTWRREGR